MCAWQSGGAIPGLTSDGAGGIVVRHALTAGDANAAAIEDIHKLFGLLQLQDTPGNMADFDPLLFLNQSTAVPAGGGGEQGFAATRSGSIAAHDYDNSFFDIEDVSGSAQSVLRVQKGGTVVLEINAIKSITGALSTVTDAAAKAVLTSIIATLTGIKVATNNTT